MDKMKIVEKIKKVDFGIQSATEGFSDRQVALIQNCVDYANSDNPAGLPGHQLMMIVAQQHKTIDDLINQRFPKGALLINGISEEEWEKAVEAIKSRRIPFDQQPVVTIGGSDSSLDTNIETVQGLTKCSCGCFCLSGCDCIDDPRD